MSDDPVFHIFSLCVNTQVAPFGGVAVKIASHYPFVTVRLKSVELKHLVGWAVEVRDDQVSVWENELHVMYSMSASSVRYISMEESLFLTRN